MDLLVANLSGSFGEVNFVLQIKFNQQVVTSFVHLLSLFRKKKHRYQLRYDGTMIKKHLRARKGDNT